MVARVFVRSIGALAVCLVACGPVTYTVQISDAAKSVASAKSADAPRLAPYEYYFAEANLAKAREEAATAEYEDANRFAKAAYDYGNKARELAQARAMAKAGGALSPKVSTDEALGVRAPK